MDHTPIETVFESGELVFMANLPLVLENTALIVDRNQNKLYARCIFRSTDDRPITAVLAEISCQDVWGNDLGAPVSAQYLDLQTRRDESFGRNKPMELPDKNTRKIQVAVKKVLFADGTVAEGGEVAGTIPAPVLLSAQLGSVELAQQYARETTPQAQFVPYCGEERWLCTCGALNTCEEEACHRCGCTKEQLTTVLDAEALNAHLADFHAAQEQAKQAEALRIQEAAQRAEADRLRQVARLQALAAEEEKKKHRKKRLIVALISVVVVIALACATIFYGVPYYKYQQAVAAMESGQYEEAYSIFSGIPSFSNSAELAFESIYRKATMELENKQYDLAIADFSRCGTYKDSADMVKETKYQQANDWQEKENYLAAHAAFKALGDYSDSKDELLVTIILWETHVLSSRDRYITEGFTEAVTLTSDQYELYYGTLLLFIEGHDDPNWWGDQSCDTMLTILKELPSNYKDTAKLIKLFTAIRDNRSDIFEDNRDVMYACWDLKLVKNFAMHNSHVTSFLLGYWSGSGYYIQFYKNSNGGTSTQYDLPRVAKPSGTRYYDIRDGIYIYADANSKELAKVYRFELIDQDTIRVYCYKNGYTYTMYRY